MSITRRVALAAVLALSACSSSSSSNIPAGGTFDGTWVVCRNDGDGLDYREVFTIAGGDLTVDRIGYETSDATCDGDGVAAGSLAATVIYGATVAAPLHSGTVQATEVDITSPGAEPYYTILYRDAATHPEILYNGDDSGTLDGSTPALRPNTLQDLRRALQTSPVAADLAGTWSSCTGAGGGVLEIDTVARTLRATKWDGPCGTGTPIEDLSFMYTLADPVYALHGDLTVTAFAVDLHRAATTGFQTFWVDVTATPPALYHGDDGRHGMDGSTPSLRPRVLSDVASLRR